MKIIDLYMYGLRIGIITRFVNISRKKISKMIYKFNAVEILYNYIKEINLVAIDL